jgi:hypothetical protein
MLRTPSFNLLAWAYARYCLLHGFLMTPNACFILKSALLDAGVSGAHFKVVFTHSPLSNIYVGQIGTEA